MLGLTLCVNKKLDIIKQKVKKYLCCSVISGNLCATYEIIRQFFIRNNRINTMNELAKKLLNKSQEAFLMSIEIYNKPTLMYRVEGFCFFICNAWELLLKAYLIEKKGSDSIYFKDNKNRTISLEQCIKSIFTNNKDPLRINLEHIIELRNICTHFITEEYEQIYVPLFQSCVINYADKIYHFFGEDITSKISANFLTLSIRLDPLTENSIKAKYTPEIADKILSLHARILDETSSINNSHFAIKIEHSLMLTKDKHKADAFIAIVSKSENNVINKDINDAIILKEQKDMHLTHPFTMKQVIVQINNKIEKENIAFHNPVRGNNSFNKSHFQLFLRFYEIKSDNKLCYNYKINERVCYTYSQKVVDFIIGKIKEDPEGIIIKLKEKTKIVSTPGAKEF